ncbi:MAG: HNH endonuclease [Chthoniobacterales bacterium]
MVPPFAYADKPHRRKHGPKGYRDHRQYREWLRDEWTFRCAYCLRRELWLTRRRDWHVEHFAARALRADLALDYENLVFACAACNGAKATKKLPDPCNVAYGDLVEVAPDGQINAKNDEGRYLIEKMQLDDEECTRLRRVILGIVELAREHADSAQATVVIRELLGFPENLPDLANQPEPPGGNSRPEGLKDCFFALRARNELPDYY